MTRLWSRLQGGPLVFFLSTVLLAAVVGLWPDQRPAEAAPPRQGGDHYGESCADCHLDFKAAWERGVHAIAFTRESFQEAWANFNNDRECLVCHTTNYQANEDRYLAPNIVCEACHGLNPPDHPPAEMVIGTDARMCGQCHTGTFSEWRRSPHAFTDDMGTVACSTCHNPHGQTVRFATTNDLCLNCHQSAPNTYVHLTHNEVAFENVEVTCASCHMHRTQGLGDGTRDDVVGHNIPDHTMSVDTAPCTDCHEALSIQGNVPLLVDVDTARAEERDRLRAQVSDLQAALEEQVAQEAEASINYVQLTQGLIVGLGLGITLTWVLIRRESTNSNARNRRPPTNDRPPDNQP